MNLIKRPQAAWLILCGVSVCMFADVRGARPVYAVPESGAIVRGVYQNGYFGMRYPLPSGWQEDLKGPTPSVTGYYSLVALKPVEGLAATELIAAQDNFFAAQPTGSAVDFLAQVQKALDPSLSSPEAPAAVEIAGKSFARLDYSGAGLQHAIFATEIRCHTVIFSLTSGSPDAIRNLADSLKRISFAVGESAHPPACIRDYASAGHILHRIAPAFTGPRFATVPVRIIIRPDGHVVQVHTIAGFPEQMQSVRSALARWVFRPYIVNGHPAEVETGISFQFSPPKE